jgi:quinol-cytochrome oxidoreductase complex cytochrome b subunit
VPPVRRRLPALGWLILMLLVIQIATGIQLSFYYQPSPEMASSSVQYIMRDVSWGWLIRGMHHWASHLIVALALLQVLKTFLTGAYRGARGSNWCIGLILLFLMLVFAYSGKILTWDNDAYWSVSLTVGRVDSVPVIGPVLAPMLRGGGEVTAPTLSRTYSTHVLLLPWVTFFLVLVNFWLLFRSRNRSGGR